MKTQIKMTKKARKAAKSLAVWYSAYNESYDICISTDSPVTASQWNSFVCACILLRDAQEETGIEMIASKTLAKRKAQAEEETLLADPKFFDEVA